MQARIFSAFAAATMIWSAAATLATAADPAPAAAPPPSANTPTGLGGKPPGDPNQVVCKYVEVTGSHLGGSKRCMTRAQWEEYSREAREDTELLQRQGLSGYAH